MSRLKCLNADALKIIAMVLMLCDHAWGTIAVEHEWLTAIGRMAFPIFAFQLVEGFNNTSNLKKYIKRVFEFALLSEIPFNMMVSGEVFFPFHQNVMFTFVIALLMLTSIEQTNNLIFKALIAVGFTLLGAITFVDYGCYGILTVLLFYICKDKKFGWIFELLGMIVINWYLLGGLVYHVNIFGNNVMIPEQGIAVFALIPIWLYNEKRGKLKYTCYIFYPLHITILVILSRILYT